MYPRKKRASCRVDESVCPTLPLKALQPRGAGAFACQALFSRLLTLMLGDAVCAECPRANAWGYLIRRHCSPRVSKGKLFHAFSYFTPSCLDARESSQESKTDGCDVA
jgi:hypothetical protein